jgi:hypothetical protein
MLKRSAHVCLLDPVTSLPVVFGDSPAQHMAAVRPAPTRAKLSVASQPRQETLSAGPRQRAGSLRRHVCHAGDAPDLCITIK